METKYLLPADQLCITTSKAAAERLFANRGVYGTVGLMIARIVLLDSKKTLGSMLQYLTLIWFCDTPYGRIDGEPVFKDDLCKFRNAKIYTEKTIEPQSYIQIQEHFIFYGTQKDSEEKDLTIMLLSCLCNENLVKTIAKNFGDNVRKINICKLLRIIDENGKCEQYVYPVWLIIMTRSNCILPVFSEDYNALCSLDLNEYTWTAIAPEENFTHGNKAYIVKDSPENGYYIQETLNFVLRS